MLKLIENEVIKSILRKKMILISAILLILIILFAYGELHTYEATINRYVKTSGQTSNYDWTGLVKQQISDLQKRLDSPYIQDNSKKSITIQIEQYQYYLDNNINPITPTVAKFTANFMKQALFMFIPLLIIILAADNISGEFSTKTIKVLLTRAVPRWKILLSKYIALLLLSAVMILETAVICIIVASFMFNKWGWNEPIVTGFKVISSKLDSSSVIEIYQWQYIILIYSLGWFVANAVGTLSFMVSVLVRNTATSIGIMMATLIGGQFLQYFLSDWPLVKYFYSINLNLAQYLTGSYQPVQGMSFIFSTMVLIAWSILALIISFSVFNKQDVLV